jgi:hypothetical protein
VSASYGLEEGTGCVSLGTASTDPNAVEPNTVALMVMDDPKGRTVSVHLIDAGTDIELARLDQVEVSISI